MTASPQKISWDALLTSHHITDAQLGIVIVDHGSRREQSNLLLHDVVQLFRQITGRQNVHVAHMELAAPSITDAFQACVADGAQLVVVHPYFLSPGRHWATDIPRLAAEAASACGNVRYLVTAPLGLHNLMAQIMQDRIEHCLAHSAGQVDACDVCAGTDQCRIR
ncbi:MAG: CbiX/SirB N-terminal domain-containing protein [Pirellulaceae bacterium]